MIIKYKRYFNDNDKLYFHIDNILVQVFKVMILNFTVKNTILEDEGIVWQYKKDKNGNYIIQTSKSWPIQGLDNEGVYIKGYEIHPLYDYYIKKEEFNNLVTIARMNPYYLIHSIETKPTFKTFCIEFIRKIFNVR